MRKCRVTEIKLTPANEAFLEFCQQYDTPKRERYRKAYERKDAREKQIIEQGVESTASAQITTQENEQC
jgi:hypothetical protein